MKLVVAGFAFAILVGIGLWWVAGTTTFELQTSSGIPPIQTPNVVLCQPTARHCDWAPGHERH